MKIAYRRLTPGGLEPYEEGEGTVLDTGAVSPEEKPPWSGCPGGRIGRISSLCTLPAFRRRSIAKGILSCPAEDAGEWDCGVLHITASQTGLPLYRSFGFGFHPRFLQYRL